MWVGPHRRRRGRPHHRSPKVEDHNGSKAPLHTAPNERTERRSIGPSEAYPTQMLGGRRRAPPRPNDGPGCARRRSGHPRKRGLHRAGEPRRSAVISSSRKNEAVELHLCVGDMSSSHNPVALPDHGRAANKGRSGRATSETRLQITRPRQSSNASCCTSRTPASGLEISAGMGAGGIRPKGCCADRRCLRARSDGWAIVRAKFGESFLVRRYRSR